MSFRTWLFSTLTTTPAITNYVGTRVFPKKSMKSSVEAHPFIVFKLGVNANEDLSETNQSNRQYFQIFVHDHADGETGDYLKIDDILKAIKETLVNAASASDELISIIYLETSQDFEDETLNTVYKYMRFQAILGKAE